MSSQFNDNDDDTPLYTRRAGAADATGNDRRADEVAQPRHAEREVTLNTGVVLGLFFALALLCAVFFGFGYSIGHKSAPPAAAADPDPAPAESIVKAGTKPTPGFPAAQPVPEYVPSSIGDRPSPASKLISPPVAVAARADKPANDTGTTSAKPPALRTPAQVAPVAVASAAPVAAGPGSSYVQIAAISHQEDADVLLSALRRRGYAVLTRSDNADKLIHVQVGPFGSRKEAEAMRLKLAADGYNAFIK